MWHWVLATILLAVALGCFGLGYRVGVVAVRASDRRAEAITAMPVVTGVDQLDGALAGQLVLVEGRVGPGTPGTDYPDRAGATRRFVAYTVTRVDVDPPDRDGGVRSNSVTERVESPPLALALTDGAVRAANAGYALGSSRSYGTTPEGRGVSGFAEGDPVVVEGTVVEVDGGLALRASTVSGVLPQAYVNAASDQRGRGVYILFGRAAACGVPFLIAAVLLGFFAWRAQRRGAGATPPDGPP